MSKIQEVDAITEKSKTRIMTEDELAAFEAEVTVSQEIKVKEESEKAAKLALLNKLGITEDEAKLLLS